MFSRSDNKKEEEDAIIVENVSKRFKIPHEKKNRLLEHITVGIKGTTSTYGEFWAVKDVSFTVKKGETLGIIGENGSGKSTLLKIIAGVLTPDSGSVKVNGKIPPYLEHGVGFDLELIADDNVRLDGAIMGMGTKEMEDKFEEIFEFAELPILLIDEVLSVGGAA